MQELITKSLFRIFSVYFICYHLGRDNDSLRLSFRNKLSGPSLYPDDNAYLICNLKDGN